MHNVYAIKQRHEMMCIQMIAKSSIAKNENVANAIASHVENVESTSTLIATHALRNATHNVNDVIKIDDSTTNATIKRNATRMFIDHSNCTHERNKNERSKCRRAIERANAKNDA